MATLEPEGQDPARAQTGLQASLRDQCIHHIATWQCASGQQRQGDIVLPGHLYHLAPLSHSQVLTSKSQRFLSGRSEQAQIIRRTVSVSPLPWLYLY